jgi:DMSO/TMAO reductase YedYZ molybdopterin-dependent catalytic subunit
MFEPAAINPEKWSLNVGGEVEKAFTATLADLAKMEQHEVINTMECAGNGRSMQNPKVPGIQWAKGAVGNARFRGPRLRDVLHKAGVKTSGKHVMFRGMDVVPGNVPPFIRSIPIEKALDGDTLVALEMNGTALTKNHGFPARVLTPGWVGAASCKWLAEIKVLEKEFEGNFMSPGYRFPNQPGKPGEPIKPEDTHPMTSLTVKSLISTPSDGTNLKSHSTRIQGVAWAGDAEVKSVEVSIDGGTTWQAAQLGKDQARYAWRLWSYDWKPSKPGAYVICSRATDSQGRTQPQEAVWNPSGYLYNVIDRIQLHVAA